MASKHNAKSFFTEQEQYGIVSAIRYWELRTSGEIKIHVENKCRSNPFDKAKKWFNKLNLANTAGKNGVLIYLAVKDQKFAVIGDSGIHDKAHVSFWNSVVYIIEEHFKEELYAIGVKEAIRLVGDELEEHFPYLEGDKNEISDDISFGE